MAVLVAAVLLLFCYSASSYPFQSQGHIPSGDPVQEWKALARVLAKERALVGIPRAGSQTPPNLHFPSFRRVSESVNNQMLFSPAIGARPVPNVIKNILRASSQPVTTEPPRSPMFESLCHLDRIYVRVRKFLFNTKTAYQRLTLGACPVNRASKDHFYFLYLLTSPCGFSNESQADLFAVNSLIHFNPVADPQQEVVWEVGFDVYVQCQYHRIHHVYSAGIHPILNSGTIFKKLTSTTSGTIILQDAAGNELTGAQPYILGQRMYFEAKLMGAQSVDQRLYVNKCYMTAYQQDSSSTMKHTVIDKQGCMQDSKVTIHATFIKQSSKMSVQFSLGAFLFTDMMGTPGTPKKIDMHCEVALGPLIATESSKSCTYDSTGKTWRELHDDDAVCTCCDSFCAAPPMASTVMLQSSPLEVEYSHALDLLKLPSGNLYQSKVDYMKSR